VTIGNEEELTVETVFHSYAVAGNYSKVATLLAYLTEFNPTKSIIFSHTKRGADILYEVLREHGYDAAVIHGDLSQAQREKSLSTFRSDAKYLIATNVAARGLDITDVSDVINFDIPEDPYVYVHRVGRSARMGASGNAMTIITDKEVSLIHEIEDSANIRMSLIELNKEPFKHVGFNYTHRKYQNQNRDGRNDGFRNQRRRSNNSSRPRNRNRYQFERRNRS
ncbi:MAG TPA: C-terminal helicase domain-containing protein, partial [Thermoplasmataceae archaeon]|nr:C-terminal helicase domain-containing protein [Thermoplasmataceae archaeon]